jgi:3-phosphoshikimate 1-carboxyvinyltransferase
MSEPLRVEPAAGLRGHFAVPGDKSVSHRALLLGAISEGETHVRGWGRSQDTESTLGAVRALGAAVDELGDDELVVHGVGLRGLRSAEIDCGNAGTLARLIVGLLAFQDGTFTLTGDESLSSRPMGRVSEPLARMGARIETTGGKLPLTITGSKLTAIEYELPVASAQVKSAVLLAGLGAEGRTTVIEPVPSRDHTELMLRAAGVRVARRRSSIALDPPQRLSLGSVDVPGDFSSAAPFVVAATLVPASDIVIHGVNLNPRRTGLLDVLDRMGARVGVVRRRRVGSEWVGDLEVRSAELTATRVAPEEVPLLVDELPLFALLAAGARGESAVSGAHELRLKETDRIDAVVDALRAIGARAQGREDGFVVTGVPARPRGGTVDARGDHRIAMLGAVAGLWSRDGVRIEQAESVGVSFPGFFDLLAQLAQTPGQLR